MFPPNYFGRTIKKYIELLLIQIERFARFNKASNDEAGTNAARRYQGEGCTIFEHLAQDELFVVVLRKVIGAMR
jgi:hypothetical protein